MTKPSECGTEQSKEHPTTSHNWPPVLGRTTRLVLLAAAEAAKGKKICFVTAGPTGRARDIVRRAHPEATERVFVFSWSGPVDLDDPKGTGRHPDVTGELSFRSCGGESPQMMLERDYHVDHFVCDQWIEEANEAVTKAISALEAAHEQLQRARSNLTAAHTVRDQVFHRLDRGAEAS